MSAHNTTKTILILAALILIMTAAGAESADPRREVKTGAAVAEGETQVLSFPGMDFGDGTAWLRFKAETDSEMTVGVILDDQESAPVVSVTFRPVNKEARRQVLITGVHDVYIALKGSGTLISWQAFAAPEDIEAAIRAENGTAYDDAVPARYLRPCEEGGTVEKFTYEGHDYTGAGAAYQKTAYVYLPHGYDPAQTYDLLILCHGIGGSEAEWGLPSGDSRVKRIMDNLIAAGEIRPFLVVTPNGRAGKAGNEAFYQFDRELRNDLLPALQERYAVDIRDRHRCAMAGLSMGGMQTVNMGLGKCLGLFSAFGAFSAAPTTNTAAVTAAVLNASPEMDVRVFYSVCGTEDTVAIRSAEAAVNGLDGLTGQLSEKNLFVQYIPGGHDFNVWYLGFYNFARMIGR